MLICGVKLTHDGGIAVLEGNKLMFSIEAEKVGNSARYSNFDKLDSIIDYLRLEGLTPGEIDRFTVDGWASMKDGAAPSIDVTLNTEPMCVPVAPYIHGLIEPDPLKRTWFTGLPGSPISPGYASFSHVAGHVMTSYCTSPFAKASEDAMVLVWDGGMLPQLYMVRPNTLQVEALGPLFSLIGNTFSAFCQEFEPYLIDRSLMSAHERDQRELEVPGKAMAYAGMGRVEPSTFDIFDRLTAELSTLSVEDGHVIGRTARSRRDILFPGLSNADLIASFQAYIGHLMVESFKRHFDIYPHGKALNLCMSGGCGLNIKWNSALRSSGLFNDVWIPPFTNDSGGAIGSACCEMVRETRSFALDWSVYSGPSLRKDISPTGWGSRSCSEEELAQILHQQNEPIAVLSGRAELGPRALGNRSLLAPAVDTEMKQRLNQIKGRESYRPVAPICLAEHAREIFEPGSDDPYMLFDHHVRRDWLERVPAIVHLDGTARLQTIGAHAENTAVRRILEAYHKVSGVPLLCNTSANLNGRGFFPDVATAAQWGKTKYIWSDGVLHTNPQ